MPGGLHCVWVADIKIIALSCQGDSAMAITRWIALALVAVSMLVLRVDESFADAGSPADTASASSTASTDQLGEIMVTAEKRDERLRDVPLSVTAATGDQLSLLGIDSAADLEKIVPGFTYRQSQNGTPVFAIRGIGFYSEQAAVAPTVTIYQDQIPLPYARMTEGVPMDGCSRGRRGLCSVKTPPQAR